MICSLSFFLLFYYSIARVVSQAPTTSGAPAPTPSTIVDILSSQVEYSYFLRHLQRHGMIPILNSLSNVTLLAPVNLAFTSGSEVILDNKYDNNILLRYVVDQRFRVGYLGPEKVVYNTLYDVDGSPYPITVSPNVKLTEYVVDDTAAIVEVDVHAKHQDSFIQGIDSLLPIKPSLCDVLMSNNDEISLGPYQISFMKLLFKQVFEDHGQITETDYENYAKVINNKRSDLKTLPKSCEELMSRTKTMFVLTDSYISESVPEITRTYLLSLNDSEEKYSMTKEAILEIKYDVIDFLESLMIDQLIGGINGTSDNYRSINSKSEFSISLAENSEQLLLNNKISSATNATSLAMSNGMLHVFDIQNQTYRNFFKELSIPLVSMIPRKSLYAMRFSYYVREINFRALHHLIDGSTSNQTILVELAQKDSVIDDDFLQSDFQTSYFSYKESVYYQFSDEMIDVESIMKKSSFANFYKLITSKLCSRRKIGSCFKTKFSASYDNALKKIDATINDEINIMLPGIKTANDNIIYLTKQEIYPPLYLKQSLLKLLSSGGVSRHLENFEIDRKSFLNTLRYLEQFGLLSLSENHQGYSIFLPCGYVEQEKNSNLMKKRHKFIDPWQSMGLILKFLESNPDYFKDVLKGLFIEGTIYSDFGISEHENERISKNLRGDNVIIRDSYIDDYSNHLLTLNNTDLFIPLNSDILFDQGIVHVINKVLLPESFRISFSDLLKTTEDLAFENFSFLDLINHYPKLSDTLGLTNESISPPYSLLVPSPDSLKDFNITSSFTKLWDFLEFHLIPNSELDKLLACINKDVFPTETRSGSDVEYNIKTNISDAHLECERNPYNNKVFLRLMLPDTAKDDTTMGTSSYNKDKEVQIISHGCTIMHDNSSSSDGACVFLIDKPLNLEWLEDPDKRNFLHIHIGFISVGIGIILGLLLFGMLVFTALLFLGRSKSNQQSQQRLSSGLKNDSILEGTNLNYMKIQIAEDNNVCDGGYETDDDILNAENDHLLPLYGKRPKRKNYGATSNEGITAPVSIKSNNLTKALNRERNLPGGF